jgi:hypothetical protein
VKKTNSWLSIKCLHIRRLFYYILPGGTASDKMGDPLPIRRLS